MKVLRRRNVKSLLPFFMLAALLISPVAAGAFGLEIAVGGWYQMPEGDVAYDPLLGSDTLDVEDDLDYDDKFQFSGRINLDLPFYLPNLYVILTPMKFDGNGQKDVNFKFGDVVFSGNVDFDSEVKSHHIDVALYYGLPFIETATGGIFNVDLGLNVKIIDFDAEIDQPATGLDESESFILPIPTVYLGSQIRPTDWLALEFEGRGIALSGDSYLGLIGRLKVTFFDPFFVAAGYRYETVDFDEQGVEVDATIAGPFAEIGFAF